MFGNDSIPLQRGFDLGDLPCAVGAFVDVLQVAAAAGGKMRAGSGDALRRWGFNGNDIALVIVFGFGDAGGDVVAGGGFWDVNGLIVVCADAVAASPQGVDGEGYDLRLRCAFGHRGVLARLWRFVKGFYAEERGCGGFGGVIARFIRAIHWSSWITRIKRVMTKKGKPQRTQRNHSARFLNVTLYPISGMFER